MCVVCGCSEPGTSQARPSESGNPLAPVRSHQHQPAHNAVTGDLHYGAGASRVSVPGMSQARAIRLEADVLGANDRIAAANRQHFAAHGVRALNLVSSPGSGKTTLLCATIAALRQRAPGLPLAVIEGDQQTSLDADRIRATGAAAIQVNTGKGCHLDAQMVADAFGRLPLHGHAHQGQPYHHGHGHQHEHQHQHQHPDHHPGDPAAAMQSLLLIENVGNLVCPALWDLGEAAKVAILSVTEGEDKPLKYPDLFAASQLMVINKIDLLPHLDFDVERCIASARRVNPEMAVLQVSARTGEGMNDWLDWLLQRSGATGSNPDAPQGNDADARELADLRLRVQALEARLATRG